MALFPLLVGERQPALAADTYDRLITFAFTHQRTSLTFAMPHDLLPALTTLLRQEGRHYSVLVDNAKTRGYAKVTVLQLPQDELL